MESTSHYDQIKSRGVKKHSVKEYQDTHSHIGVPRNVPKKQRNRPQKQNHKCYLPRHHLVVQTIPELNYKVTDFSVTQSKHGPPQFREHWVEKPLKLNPQHETIVNHHKAQKLNAKVVHLPKIYENLYVANEDYANNFDEETSPKFDVIINLTDTPVIKRPGVKIINVPLVDEHYYLRFSQNTAKVNSLLKMLDEIVDNNQTILLHCMAGTNRSPFIAALFGKKNSNKPGQWYIDYIEDEKLLQGYENWDTFSNISYIHRLDQQQ